MDNVATISHKIDGLIAHLQGKGLGGNTVRDLPNQLQEPEVAAWTGKGHRLMLHLAGEEVRLILCRGVRGQLLLGESEPERFTGVVAKFLTWDGALR